MKPQYGVLQIPIFILEFDREKFFRVDADTVDYHQFSPATSLDIIDIVLPSKSLIIDGSQYRQGDSFQAVYMGKGERECIVFVYGEPKPLEIEYRFNSLTQAGTNDQ